MRIDVVTIFPEMIEDLSKHGVLGRAINNDVIQINTWNPRDYVQGEYKQIDDRPYGGSSGMLMMIEPLHLTLHAAQQATQETLGEGRFKTIYLSPQGKRLNQSAINQFAGLEGIIMLCGRYKGVDERVVEMYIDEEWSMGDYVISGGELAAMALIDAVARQQEGVLGNEDSAQEDSFSTGLLDAPHYTRPYEYAGRQVPKVLLEGNHEEIRLWRLKQALGRTLKRRPDLLRDRQFTVEERCLLNNYVTENNLVFPVQSMEKDDD